MPFEAPGILPKSPKRAMSRRVISHLLSPGEIAKALTPEEHVRLHGIVAENWAQAFGIVTVQRLRRNVAVEIELEDDTHHDVTLLKEPLNA
jgi:hypothetical protein